jgi:hypothetical protein
MDRFLGLFAAFVIFWAIIALLFTKNAPNGKKIDSLIKVTGEMCKSFLGLVAFCLVVSGLFWIIIKTAGY